MNRIELNRIEASKLNQNREQERKERKPLNEEHLTVFYKRWELLIWSYLVKVMFFGLWFGLISIFASFFFHHFVSDRMLGLLRFLFIVSMFICCVLVFHFLLRFCLFFFHLFPNERVSVLVVQSLCGFSIQERRTKYEEEKEKMNSSFVFIHLFDH